MYDSQLFLPLNAQEMADFYNYMKSINIDRAWINGNNDNDESEWRDSNHNPINYFNWGQGQPNRSGNYIAIYATWDGRWNDDSSRHTDYIICHKPLNGNLFLSSHNFPKKKIRGNISTATNNSAATNNSTATNNNETAT